MKFLIDNCLSPELADRLRVVGLDAIHVRSLGIHEAEDQAVVDAAIRHHRTIITADSDFGTILVLSGEIRPSVILFRGGVPHEPARQIELLTSNLEAIQVAIQDGSVVVFREGRIRARRLPISD